MAVVFGVQRDALISFLKDNQGAANAVLRLPVTDGSLWLENHRLGGRTQQEPLTTRDT